jgi:perosamine synthetase
MYSPINQQAAYGLPGEHTVSQRVGEKGLWLPSSSHLKNEDIKRICETIKTFYTAL